MKFLQGARTLRLRLGDPRIEALNETEKVIIIPFLGDVSAYAEKLSGVTAQLQLPKCEEQDER
jgi:hypothetical protein